MRSKEGAQRPKTRSLPHCVTRLGTETSSWWSHICHSQFLCFSASLSACHFLTSSPATSFVGCRVIFVTLKLCSGLAHGRAYLFSSCLDDCVIWMNVGRVTDRQRLSLLTLSFRPSSLSERLFFLHFSVTSSTVIHTLQALAPLIASLHSLHSILMFRAQSVHTPAQHYAKHSPGAAVRQSEENGMIGRSFSSSLFCRPSCTATATPILSACFS